MAVVQKTSFHVAREAICQILEPYDLLSLTDEDKAAILAKLNCHPVHSGRRISRKVWERETEATICRLGLVKSERPTVAPIRCEPVHIAPVQAGNGKNAALIQPPIFDNA